MIWDKTWGKVVGSCDMLANFEITRQIYSRDQVKQMVSDNGDGASSSGKMLLLLEHSLKQGHCQTLLILGNGDGHWYFGSRKIFPFKQHLLGIRRRRDKPWSTSTTEIFGKLLKEFPSLSGLCSVQTLASNNLDQTFHFLVYNLCFLNTHIYFIYLFISKVYFLQVCRIC